ncbi:MAG: LysR family transcriptional regulator [Eggerthellaceae bacterium]
MRVEDLRYFEHVAKVLNYTRASKDLHISQPALSLAVKRLEEEWGVQLLERNRAAVELTDIGRDIMECVSSALYDLDRARMLAEESLGAENAEINLGTIYAMQGKFWSQALFDFRRQCSHDPQITVTQAYSKELLRRLRAGQLDVAFASRIGDMRDLQYSLCWSQSLVLGVNKRHPFAQKDSISLTELEGMEILSYNPYSPVTEGLRNLIDDYGLNVQYAFDDEITLSSIISADQNQVALFCYSLLINAFDDVVCLPIREAPVDFHKTYVVSRDESRRPRVVQEFIDFMSAYRFPRLLDYGRRNIEQ